MGFYPAGTQWGDVGWRGEPSPGPTQEVFADWPEVAGNLEPGADAVCSVDKAREAGLHAPWGTVAKALSGRKLALGDLGLTTTSPLPQPQQFPKGQKLFLSFSKRGI